MLRLSSQITNVPVFSLRTGGPIATAVEPIINPNNLTVEGWYCTDRFDKKTLILLTKDLRDFVPKGMAVNDHEDLVDPGELIRLQDVLKLDYTLIGKAVATNQGRKLGRVGDYAVDVDSFIIQKIYVDRPVYRSLTDGQLSIDHSQVVETTPKKIIVKEADVRANATQKPNAIRPATA